MVRLVLFVMLSRQFGQASLVESVLGTALAAGCGADMC